MSKWIKNWFSNMLPNDEPFVYQGITFTCVENFYQAMKTLDVNERRKIANMNSFQAKRYIRLLPLRPDWENIKVDVMCYALRIKFAEGTTWYQKLMDTGEEEIVEWNNWGDTFWGVDVRTNKGENHLGRLLMEIRRSK